MMKGDLDESVRKLRRRHAGILLLVALTMRQTTSYATESFVTIATNHGDMRIVLFNDDAPQAVKHFSALVTAGRYNGKMFYRVVAGKYIQGGIGYDEARNELSVRKDAGSKHRHIRGVIGFAREDVRNPDSGTTEIYICVSDQADLDRLGFVAFGQVIEGLSVLDEIANVPVRQKWLYWDGEILSREIKEDSVAVAWHEPVEAVIIANITIDRPHRK
jgi:cyclophilin family peptidyl-prolyl cis-trans isomerase